MQVVRVCLHEAGRAQEPFVLRAQTSAMRARWAAMRSGDECGSNEPASEEIADDWLHVGGPSAMELFRAGVIQGQSGSNSAIEDGALSERLSDDAVVPAVMESKPKAKPVKQGVVVRDDGDTGASSSSALSAEVPFNNVTLEEDRMRCTDKRQFLYPWERGPLKRLFGDISVLKKPKLAVQPSSLNTLKVAVSIDSFTKATAFIDKVAVESSSAIFVGVVHSSVDIDHKTAKAQKRIEVVGQWWSLISQELRASNVGRQVVDEISQDRYDDYGKELLDACFGLKSPDTLRKRFLSMKAYSDWCGVELQQSWLPLRESQAWLYIKHMKDTGAPATRAASFMEAVRFCWYVIGIDGGDEIQSSLRAKGLSSQLFITKRPWRPADLLCIKEVLRLHSVLSSSEHNLVDRVIVGHLLHLLYVRARWSDMFSVRNGVVDRQHTFFELETQIHKSAKGADSKSKLLPLVCPCIGIDGEDWVSQYLAVRDEAGLEMPGSCDVCMLPAPSGSDMEPWSSRPLSSEEGARFLRKILDAPKTSERRLSSHSLKSTAISWTAKYGLNFEARALLARHSSSVANPTALYSRDLLSPVMRSFVVLLSHIQDGQFAPDETRSGMLTPKPVTTTTPGTPVSHGVQLRVDGEFQRPEVGEPQVIECKSSEEDEPPKVGVTEIEESPSEVCRQPAVESDVHPAVEEPLEDGWSSTSESNADDSSSSDEDGRIKDIYQHYGNHEPLQFDVFINNTSLVLHCVGATGRFRCGRLVTKTYSRVHELNGIRCTRCFDV